MIFKIFPLSEVSLSVNAENKSFVIESDAKNVIEEEGEEVQRPQQKKDAIKKIVKINFTAPNLKILKEWMKSFDSSNIYFKKKKSEINSTTQKKKNNVKKRKIFLNGENSQKKVFIPLNFIPTEEVENSSNQVEHVEWLNLLMQRHFKEMCCSYFFKKKVSAKIQKQLDNMFYKNRGKSLPSTIGPLSLQKFFLGSSFFQIEGFLFFFTYFIFMFYFLYKIKKELNLNLLQTSTSLLEK